MYGEHMYGEHMYGEHMYGEHMYREHIQSSDSKTYVSSVQMCRCDVTSKRTMTDGLLNLRGSTVMLSYTFT